MQRQRIPNDNSCLFTAIDYCVSGEFVSEAAARRRQQCVAAIKRDATGSPPCPCASKYTELYLGKDRDDYCEWLLKDSR
jgi:hypothetical protein